MVPMELSGRLSSRTVSACVPLRWHALDGHAAAWASSSATCSLSLSVTLHMTRACCGSTKRPLTRSCMSRCVYRCRSLWCYR